MVLLAGGKELSRKVTTKPPGWLRKSTSTWLYGAGKQGRLRCGGEKSVDLTGRAETTVSFDLPEVETGRSRSTRRPAPKFF